MRVPLSWLREWVDVPWDVDELAERLTGVGLAVDAIERPGEEVRGVVIARIERVAPHPEAESLRICTVATGRGLATVVTGAPNAREGAMAVYAPPGARLAGGLEVGEREIRGVRSQGLLCATWELGLPSAAKTEDERWQEGLLLLPAQEGLDPGQDAAPLLDLGEPVLVLDLTPNYAAHCQSIWGVAREVAALTGGSVHPPALPEVPLAEDDTAERVAVQIEDAEGCSRYVARIIDDVQVGPSPLWLRRRLQLAGMRPINNVVDVTNYVMLETGQPLHGFDHSRIAGSRIIVRRARAGERLRTLDGEERVLGDTDLVIADSERAVALAGIMGGADSEVTPHTRCVLLESAHFSPRGILRTARRLGLRTEASIRFEKGFDPEGVQVASQRAAVLIASLAGGRILRGSVDVVARQVPRRRIPFRPGRINGLLGTELSEAEVRRYLERYGFVIRGDQVEVPSYRTDIEGEADLAEEVARLYGYDRIPALLPTGAPATTGRADRDRDLLAIRRHMVACGFTEVTTFSFARADLADRLRLPADHPQRRAVRLANPMNEEQAALRTTLLGSMLEVVRHNLRRRLEDLALFEIGTVYLPASRAAADGRPDLPREHQHLILAATGDIRPRHWQSRGEPADVFLLKGVIVRLAERLGLALELESRQLPFLHPGRAAVLRAGGREIGYLGELHPDLAEAWELADRLSLLEVDLTTWLATERQQLVYRPLPRYPAVERDVAFILPVDVPASEAERVIRTAAGDWLESVVLFDVYQGKPVPEGHRSLAYALRYRAPDRTLTDEEVDAVHGRVRERLVQELNATLR